MSTHALAQPAISSKRSLKLAGVAILTAALATLLLLMLVASLLGMGVVSLGGAPERFGVSALAEAEIPPLYLSLYEQAARRYGLEWAILAGIGKVECDHGRDPDPSCTKRGAVNSAGAGGPAQFLASTWAEYGVDVDGEGPPDRWDPADAIYGMANYLHASGAPQNYRKAIYAYNHAWWYVNEVEHWASLYRGPAQTAVEIDPGSAREVTDIDWPGVGAVETIAGTRALLSPGDGHLALVPAQAPAVVQAMVIAGNELQDLPYGPDGHPDPLGAPDEDCSSTVNYVLYRSGIRLLSEILRENPLAQDYVDWGAPGPGRWVTIYATTEPTDHVFIVIAGLRLDTSYKGTDVGPNRDEGGPRWRILDHIPSWAHWLVRHPPGL
ncbi:MAG TPA: lytic transglycosylase domain-containing protein [Solirubrobacteraceae bacterium]|nr:lytic transglycosylase domain-containing protein [Solirubrobacteraceae bacterium]